MSIYFSFISFRRNNSSKGEFYENTYSSPSGMFLCTDDRCRFLFQKESNRRKRFRFGRQKRRSLAYGFCVRYILLLSRNLCRLCRTVRLELRFIQYMGRFGQCLYRFTPRLEHLRQKNPCHDTALRCKDHA